MRYMEFVIGAFDNSQIIKELKFQAGGSSSSVTLVTSRIFIKPMVPHGLPLFRFPIVCPEITYLHQNIPSAYGMPEFEDITSINPDVYSNFKYLTVNSSTDITDAQVGQYMKLVLVVNKINRLRCIIPFWCTKF